MTIRLLCIICRTWDSKVGEYSWRSRDSVVSWHHWVFCGCRYQLGQQSVVHECSAGHHSSWYLLIRWPLHQWSSWPQSRGGYKPSHKGHQERRGISDATNIWSCRASDSSGPPDITSAAYEKTEEVEDIEIKDYSYVDSPNSPAPLLTSLEEQGEFTDFPTELPEDPQNIFPDTDPPPDLLHQEDLTPTEGYLGSSFPESSLSESLLAVAPGDILPVVSLPQINPNFFQQNLSPTLAQNIKRGPGRPRKDGQEPAPRRRSS